MSFHNVPNLQVARYGITVPVVQRLLVPPTDRTDHDAVAVRQICGAFLDIISSGPLLRAIDD